MPKPSHREKLLAAGLQVVLEQGYCGASVRDIVQAAGVPQGSFTNHFRSKEAFCLEVPERYFTLVRANIKKTLRNDTAALRKDAALGQDGHACMASAETSRNSFSVAPLAD